MIIILRGIIRDAVWHREMISTSIQPQSGSTSQEQRFLMTRCLNNALGEPLEAATATGTGHTISRCQFFHQDDKSDWFFKKGAFPQTGRTCAAYSSCMEVDLQDTRQHWLHLWDYRQQSCSSDGSCETERNSNLKRRDSGPNTPHRS